MRAGSSQNSPSQNHLLDIDQPELAIMEPLGIDRSVSSLMMGMFSGTEKDVFGKDPEDPRTVSLLDRIMGSSRRSTGSRFLELPVEILGDIVEYLVDDFATLANLALVNIDCRQMARSAQFANISFDYSPRAQRLLGGLCGEVLNRTKGFHLPSIGACVRRVTVSSNASMVAAIHPELYQSIFGAEREQYSREHKQQLDQQASKQYIAYRSSLIPVTTVAMPNLEALTWTDKFTIDEQFFRLMTQSSVRHLKLYRVPIDLPYLLQPPFTPPSWPLRTLYLGVRSEFETEIQTVSELEDEPSNGLDALEGSSCELSGKDISVLTESLLRLCAQTLELFTWVSCFSESDDASFGTISFPRLRKARLQHLYLASNTVPSILRSPLKELDIRHLSDRCWPAVSTFVQENGSIRHLRSLAIGKLNNDNAEHVASFLQKHPHIQEISIDESPAALLENHIVPLLSHGHFANLTSLALHWQGPGINEENGPPVASVPEDHLAAIGTVYTLRQLRLLAGEDIGWRCQWMIDHDGVREQLKGLTRLRKLALCRDTYSSEGANHGQRYYRSRWPTRADEGHARERLELDEEVDFFEAAGQRRHETIKARHPRLQRGIEEANGDEDALHEPIAEMTFAEDLDPIGG